MAVSSEEEYEELEHVLRMSIEHPLSYSNFSCEKHPLVLVVEAGKEADNNKLNWESDNADDSKRNEESKQHPFSVEEFWSDFAKMSSKLNEHTKRPEKSRNKSQRECQYSPSWVLL